jgi:Polyketide cyclase / dehydrase and lipid transport
MLKKILIVMGVVVAFTLVLPLVLSQKMQITRSIEIQNSQPAVHAYLTDLNQYPKWNPFSENDPGSTHQVMGSGVGSALTWKGEKTGEGKMTITEIRAPQSVLLKLEFYTPMAGEAIVGWTTDAIDASKTRMTWSMDQNLPYFQRYFGLLMNGMIGKTFERGLVNLKKQLEKS